MIVEQVDDNAVIKIKLSKSRIDEIEEAAIAQAIQPQDIILQALQQYFNSKSKQNSKHSNDDFEFIYGKVESIDQYLRRVSDELHRIVVQDNAMCVSSKRMLLSAIGQLHGASQNNIAIAQLTFPR